MEEKLVLQMDSIVKTFPGVKALDGVHLDVRRGEVHALCGENGAGKSTLTRALAETLGLPAVYLDRLWWKSGWINRTRAEFDARLDAALAGAAWVLALIHL